MPSLMAWCTISQQCGAPSLEAVDDDELPQRAGAVVGVLVELGGQVEQLPLVPGAGSAMWRTWKSRSNSGSGARPAARAGRGRHDALEQPRHCDDGVTRSASEVVEVERAVEDDQRRRRWG